MKKLLIIGVIALFIGLAFIPSFNAVSMYKKDNHPPSKPIINGPNGGKPGISYTFNFNAVDPDGDNVSYFIKWGDGTTSGWTRYTWSGTNMPIAHTWDYICDCPIRAKAKDIYGKEGEWSDLIIRINRNKPQIIDIESTDDCGCSDGDDYPIVLCAILWYQMFFATLLFMKTNWDVPMKILNVIGVKYNCPHFV